MACIEISNIHGASTKMSRITSMIINCKTTKSIQLRMMGKRKGKYAAKVGNENERRICLLSGEG